MWKTKRSNIIIVTLSIALLIYLGFLRDSIFININYIIDKLYFNQEVTYHHSMYEFLVPMGVGGLLNLKWFLTFFFMALNLGLSWLVIKNLFTETKLALALLFWGYLLLFILSGIFFISGKLLGFPELGYTLSRRFMGVLQSPVPLMVVAAVHMLFANVKVSKT